MFTFKRREIAVYPAIVGLCKTVKKSKAPDGQGPLLTNYKPKL
jgi:hypothetical protein